MINLDTTSPLTFNQYKDYYKDTSYNEMSEAYNAYLVDWKNYKATEAVKDGNYRFNLYKEFLKNINISTFSPDIVNFLNNLDYDDPYELDLATHYFTVQLNREFDRLKDYRQDIKFSTIKNNLKASPAGVEKYLKAHILKVLKQPDFAPLANIGRIGNKLKISFVRYATNRINLDISSDTPVPNFLNRVLPEKDILNLSKKTFQLLKSKNKYIRTSSNLKLSVNQSYTNWERLPDRFFVNEIKKQENLITNYYSKIKDKYLGTDTYLLSGNTDSAGLFPLYKAENSNSYVYKYYNPDVSYNYGTKVRADKIPFQLSFNNAGLGVALSRNLTFNIDVSATNGLYYIPDPTRVQPGVSFYNNKFRAPINFNADNSWVKTYDVNSVKVRDNNSLKAAGYQSREASLKYTPTGINKVSDEFSFWKGSDHLSWKNDDAYKRYNMNSYPETERFNDLLVNNNTGIQIKNDIYGNEFILLKNTNPKRYNSGSSVTSVTAASAVPCEIYEGLYFDGALSAISAADPTAFSSLTAIYDTILFSDNPACPATIDHTNTGTFSSFFAPLSTAECSSVSGDDLVDGGPFANHPCKGPDFTTTVFGSIQIPYFSLTLSSPYTTIYQSNGAAQSRSPLYDETFTEVGSAYIRDVNDQKVYTLYEKMSAVLAKIPTTYLSAVSANEIVNLDIVGSTIVIQTSAATFTEYYSYDGNTFSIQKPARALITRT